MSLGDYIVAIGSLLLGRCYWTVDAGSLDCQTISEPIHTELLSRTHIGDMSNCAIIQ